MVSLPLKVGFSSAKSVALFACEARSCGFGGHPGEEKDKSFRKAGAGSSVGEGKSAKDQSHGLGSNQVRH